MTVIPLAGAVDGMNEDGLVVTYNYGYGQDKPRYMAPVTSLVQTVLFKASTVDEALKIIRDSKRGGSAILMVADRDRAVSIRAITKPHWGERSRERENSPHKPLSHRAHEENRHITQRVLQAQQEGREGIKR
ncbi:MAG: hypothetical protein DRN96_09435 [Thermoproteota archaeon]|nr:MAG: hypothetical protein DRN96_09435 [Candidatus Korarchaeota archaeon]